MFREEMNRKLEFGQLKKIAYKKLLKFNFNCPGESVRTEYSQYVDSRALGPAVIFRNERLLVKSHTDDYPPIE